MMKHVLLPVFFLYISQASAQATLISYGSSWGDILVTAATGEHGLESRFI